MNNFDFNRYISFVDEISNDMNYPNSIRHLLYVVVPAFIINYGIENERLILECFRKTKIYLSNNIPDNNSKIRYLGIIFCLQYLHLPPKNM